jgi:hypothetical protein
VVTRQDLADVGSCRRDRGHTDPAEAGDGLAPNLCGRGLHDIHSTATWKQATTTSISMEVVVAKDE